MSGKGKIDETERDEIPAEPESLSTNQEAVPVPFFAGRRLIALRWITPPLNVFTVQAKDGRPGKK